MIKKVQNVLSVVLLIFLMRCDCTEPKNTDVAPIIELKLIDVSVKEAYLYIDVERMKGTETVYIGRDNKSIGIMTGITNDTIYVDTTLSEKGSYTYKVIIADNGREISVSNELPVTTLERTSHDYEFETYYFGDGPSSYFNDVSIIDDSTIWVVGAVYLRDSTGEIETDKTNLYKWDGKNWTPEKVWVDTYTHYMTAAEINTIYSINPNNIWMFTEAGSYVNWTGNGWITHYISYHPGSGEQFWGTSSSDLYLVGNNGSISHRSSTGWKKIESGTTAQFNDVWGVINSVTGEQEVYIPGGSSNKLFRLNHNDILSTINVNREIITTWTNKGYPIFAGGDGIFCNKNGVWEEIFKENRYYTGKIRGNSLNDIFVVGAYGLVTHYNGIDWKVYSELKFNYGNNVSVDIKNNTVVIVGYNKGQATVTIGKRK